MDNLTFQEAQKIASAIRNGKSYYFEEYQNNGEGIFFKDGYFQVEHYKFDFHDYQKRETVYSNQLDEKQIITYLLKKPKHYFYDFLKD